MGCPLQEEPQTGCPAGGWRCGAVSTAVGGGWDHQEGRPATVSRDETPNSVIARRILPAE